MVYKSGNSSHFPYRMFVRLCPIHARENFAIPQQILAIPRRKSALGSKCFSYKSAKLWNDLSIQVKSSKTYEMQNNVSATSAVSADSLSPAMVGIILIRLQGSFVNKNISFFDLICCMYFGGPL